MNIAALLNPAPETHERRRSLRTRRLTNDGSPIDDSADYIPSQSLRKSKAKQTKDAPKFERGETLGHVRFAPYQPSDQDLIRYLKDFKVFPSSGISAYPRHIPYSSDKKDFLTKTGRDSFEVFQYTFKTRGSDKEWTVMWDYNIGLVRITPFFKCLGYAKTVPAKAIGANPGLKELCHSITGGALAAQGYWMPFEAAKALAANFCWDIRHALVPIFGKGFVNICLRPEHSGYKRHVIHPSIVRQCKQEVDSWRNASSTALMNVVASSSPTTPRPTATTSPNDDWTQRTLRARPGRLGIDGMGPGPAIPPPSFDLTPLQRLPQPNFMLERFLSPREHQRAVIPTPSTTHSSSATSSNVTGSPKGKRPFSDVDDQESMSTTSSHLQASYSQKRQKHGGVADEDAKAAYWLVQLSMDERSRR